MPRGGYSPGQCGLDHPVCQDRETDGEAVKTDLRRAATCRQHSCWEPAARTCTDPLAWFTPDELMPGFSCPPPPPALLEAWGRSCSRRPVASPPRRRRRQARRRRASVERRHRRRAGRVVGPAKSADAAHTGGCGPWLCCRPVQHAIRHV